MGERCESILSGVNDDRTDFKYVGTWIIRGASPGT